MSSCGSMPAVGVPVTLRMLSAPEPREHSPRSWISLDHGDGVVRLHFSDLDVGARRHMGVAAAVARGEIGKPRELCCRDDAVWDTQPAHVGILIGRDIEQAKKPPAEIVRRLGIFAFGRMRLQPLISIEWMLLAFELFGIGKFPARSEHAVLRRKPRGVRARGFRRSDSCTRHGAGYALRRFGNLHSGDEPFQITLLLGVEIAGIGGGGFEVRLGHSAGTCAGPVSGAGAKLRGLCVM